MASFELFVDLDTDWNREPEFHTATNRALDIVRFSVDQSRLNPNRYTGFDSTSLSLTVADSDPGFWNGDDVEGSHITLRLVEGANRYDLFTGYIRDLDIIGLTDYDREVFQVTCYDAFERLAQEELSIDSFPAQPLTLLVDALLDTVQWPTELREIGVSRIYAPEVSGVAGTSILDVLREAELADLGRLFVSRSGVVHFDPKPGPDLAPSLAIGYNEDLVLSEGLRIASGGATAYNMVTASGGPFDYTNTDEARLRKRGPKPLELETQMLPSQQSAITVALNAVYQSNRKRGSARLPVYVDEESLGFFALDMGDPVAVNMGLHGLSGLWLVSGWSVEYDSELTEWAGTVTVEDVTQVPVWKLADSAVYPRTTGNLLDSANRPDFVGDTGNTYLVA